MAIETYFKNIASAIKTKGGTVATLTPSQMPQAIADLPSGGGSSIILPKYDGQSYVVANSEYLQWKNTTSYNVFYELEANKKVLFALGDKFGNREIVSFYQIQYDSIADKITTANSSSSTTLQNGNNLLYVTSSSFDVYNAARVIYTPSTAGLLVIQISNVSSASNLTPYLFDIS